MGKKSSSGVRPAVASIACGSCGQLCADDSDFCPACGALFDADGVMCATHATRPAVAACIICGSPVCAACGFRAHDRTVCPAHAGVRIEQDFALVYSSSDINDAELAKAVLESRGLDVVTRDFQPIGYVWEGAGDSAFSRAALRKLAKVFVPIPDYLRAVQALEEWSTGRASEPEM